MIKPVSRWRNAFDVAFGTFIGWVFTVALVLFGGFTGWYFGGWTAAGAGGIGGLSLAVVLLSQFWGNP